MQILLRAIVLVILGVVVAGVCHNRISSLRAPPARTTKPKTETMSATQATVIDFTKTPTVTHKRKAGSTKPKRKAHTKSTPKKRAKISPEMKALKDQMRALKAKMAAQEQLDAAKAENEIAQDHIDKALRRLLAYIDRQRKRIGVPQPLPDKKHQVIRFNEHSDLAFEMNGRLVPLGQDDLIEDFKVAVNMSPRVFIPINDWLNLNEKFKNQICQIVNIQKLSSFDEPVFAAPATHVPETDATSEEESQEESQASPEENKKIRALFGQDDSSGEETDVEETDVESDSEEVL